MADRSGIAAFRFGYGLPLAGSSEPSDMVAALAGPDLAAARWPSVTMADVLPIAEAYRVAKKAGKSAMEGDKAALRRVVRQADALALRAAKATVARAVGSDDPLRERLVQFWADHFTVTPKNRVERSLPGALIEDAIRPNLMRPFAVMLQAVVTHPAMLIYLNQDASFGPGSKRGQRRDKGLNENLARELLELHTLGVSAAYSQGDVRQLAELLTGLTLEAGKGFVFDPGRAEPGTETVLGVTYAGAGVTPIFRALDDLAVRPETARHLAGKLAVHFVADAPEAGLVGALEKAWNGSGGDLAVVTEALLGNSVAWAVQTGKARQPFDFVVASLRALEVSADVIHGAEDKAFRRMILDPLADMGQPLWQAPGPDGWPEAAEDWITPQGLAARISWAIEVPERMVKPLPDPRVFVTTALGARASERLVWAVSAAAEVREGVGLTLAAPEFNRR
ncbi:DUF1800 domain-containing protein [Tabrizicola sp.]|uniref:DUF1800 domain-containing protein n=1 Tax=Tabrizicola sp. TaxID=2005166 RepID=UPI00286C5B85|nr:DUF1800 domain-containing protein [Tabrizicola sp.]